MLTKLIFLAVLGTSLVLADAASPQTVTKKQLKQEWIGKVNALLQDFNKTASDTYNMGQQAVDKAVKALKGKNDNAVAVIEAKRTERNGEFAELKGVQEQEIGEKKDSVLAEIEKLGTVITEAQVSKLESEETSILAERKKEYENQLKIWYDDIVKITQV